MKNYTVYALIMIFMFLGIEDIEAQKKRRKKRTRDTEEQVDKPKFTDNLAYDIGLGNPGFIFGGGSSSFNIALKPGVGYKLHDRVTAGVFFKGDFVFQNLQGTEFSLFDYGTGIFTKFKILDVLYLRGEFAYQSFERAFLTSGNNIVTERSNFTEPLVGLGYYSGVGVWSYGLELNFHLNRDVRDYLGQVMEIWLKFDRNF